MQLVTEKHQITVQHELENAKTDVVEAIVVLSGEWLTIADIKERCVTEAFSYEAIRAAIGKLVVSGRLQVEQKRNKRLMGPKMVSKYHGRPGQKPRLFV
jgi:hypothetical protein